MNIYYKDENNNFKLVDEKMMLNKVKFTEGIWLIRNILKGTEYIFMTEKLSELNNVMDLASFEPYRYKIASLISKRLEESYLNYENGIRDRVTTKDIMDIIVSVINKGRYNVKAK